MPRPIHVGDLVGAVFGAILVVANSQLLGGVVRALVSVVALAGAATIVAGFVRSRRRSGSAHAPSPTHGYLVIVAVEVVALVLGGFLLARIAPQLNVAWVAFVVGLHFVAFAIWWLPGSRVFLGIGLVMTALALVGFAVGLHGGAPSVDVVALIAGVGSGVLLLGVSTSAAVASLRAG